MVRLLHIAGVASRIPSLAANSIQVMRMADAFARLGHEVEVVVPHGAGPLPPGAASGQGAGPKAEPDPFAFYGLKSRFAIRRVWTPGEGRLGVLAFARAARATAARGEFDIVFCRNALATVLLARAGIRHLFEAHHYRLAGRVDHWLMPALRTPYVERLVLLSPALADPFVSRGVAAEKMLVAPDGVADEAVDGPPAAADPRTRAILGGDAERLLAVYAGSLDRRKGIETLLAAAGRLTDLRFAVVGGPTAQRVEAYRRLAGPNVHFAGPMPPAAIPPVLAAADCLILPHSSSSAESHLSPLKIFEYLASGRAIVATDLPATRDILTDGVNALFVPPDDPERLAEAIARLARDSELRARLGEAGRAKAREHTWTSRARRILADLPPRAPAGSLRIAHVLNSFHPLIGGAERQAAALAARQSAGGHRPLVLTRRVRGLPGLDGLGSIPIHRVPVGRLGAAGFIASGLAFLVGRDRRLDVIHAHQARANAILGYLARVLGGPPLVVKLAGLDLPRTGPLLDRARLAMLRRADAVVALTPVMRDHLLGLGVPATRLHLIPNGVDLERFQPAADSVRRAARTTLGLPAEGPVVLFAGRLEPVKGPDLLLAAWSRIRDPEALLVIAGDGPLRSGLTRQASGDPRVRLLGLVDDTAALYQAADVVVVPSRSEGLSNTLLEGMASGLAILATAVSGNVDVIEDERTGRLVPPDPESLARGLERLLSDPDARSALGRSAARVARERYDVRAGAQKIEALYRTLTGG